MAIETVDRSLTSKYVKRNRVAGVDPFPYLSSHPIVCMFVFVSTLVSGRDPRARPACRRLASQRSVRPLALAPASGVGLRIYPNPSNSTPCCGTWREAEGDNRAGGAACALLFCITPAQFTLSADHHAVEGGHGICTQPDLDCSAVWAGDWPWSLMAGDVEMFVFPSSGLPLGASRWVVVVPCSLDRRRRRIKLPA